MTVTAAITTLLLPLGVWLVVSSATPRQDENRIASSGMLALLITTAAFASFGFAFMFGNSGWWLPHLAHLRSSLNVGLPTPQPWSIVGLRGFFFQGVPFAGLTLFLPYLALAQTCAVLVNSAIAHRSSALTQIAMATAAGGVAYGIAGHWIFGGGWLAMLGQNLGFGHGTIDVGGMATVGLIVGAFAMVFVITQPAIVSGNSNTPPSPADTSFPFRTLSGALLILVGAIAVVASNPLLDSQTERVVIGFAINLLTASSVAGIFALVYTLFTSAEHKANLTSAALAMLAALISISSAGGLLPMWAAVLMGLVAGGLVTLGQYWVQVRLTRSLGPVDAAASGLLTIVFVPAVLSFVATGVMANGAVGAGWNGVGVADYLGVAQLGISGLLPLRAGVSDAGQLTAQVCGLVAVTLFAAGVAVGIIRLLRLSLTGSALSGVALNTFLDHQPQEALATKGAAMWASTLLTVSTVAESNAVAMPLQITSSGTLGSTPLFPAFPSLNLFKTVTAPEAATTIEKNTALTDEETAPQPALPDPFSNDSTLPLSSRPPRAKPFVVELAEESPPQESLVERMRKLRRSRQPAQPVRARKIAYPTRVAGRRLIRPMVEENPPKS